MRFKYIRKPYKHQHQTVLFCLKLNEAAILSDTGTGKTKSSIDSARFLFKLGKAKKVLIVSPKNVLWQWQEEIKLNSHFESEVLYGSVTERLKLLRRTKPKFFIINYDALIIDEIIYPLLGKKFDLIVFDESIKIKNWQARRTKRAFELARLAQRIIIMSARPITRDASDVFGQYLVLDGGVTFGKNFYRFRNRYYRKDQKVHFPKWVLRQGALQSIRDKMFTKAISFSKEECLDLPPKVFERKDVLLTPEQTKAYVEIDVLGKTKIDDDIDVEIKHSINRWMKKQQVVGGFLYLEEEKTHDFTPNPKLDTLQELLTEELYGEKVVVVCYYHNEMDLIKSILPGPSVEISGRTNASKQAMIFQKDPNRQYAILQIGSALGIDLFAASTMIFYSMDFHLDHYEQALGRIDRIGQTGERCLYIYLMARGTIDDHILSAIKRRKNISDYLLGLDLG